MQVSRHWQKYAKVLMKKSLCEALFCFESGSKPWKAIWWTTKSDTLQYLEIQFVHSKLGMQCDCNVIFHCPGSHLDYRVLFDSNFFLVSLGLRHAQSDTQSDTQAIPKRYPYWNDIVTEALWPPLKSLHVPWCPQQAVRKWPALSKNP